MKYIPSLTISALAALVLSLSACQQQVSELSPSASPGSTPTGNSGEIDPSPSPEPSPVVTPSASPTAQPTVQPSVTPTRSPAASYPRRPAVLVDEVSPGSDFYQFREELKQAVRDRDAAFIRAIAAPDIHLTFGLPMTLDDLEIDNPNAPFWQHLERIISIGCSPLQGVPGEGWACPHVFQAPQIQDSFQDVFIVGEGINVRAEPQASSAVVDTLSNEVVQSDPAGMESFSEAQRAALETMEGWRPVITPSGQRGYVSSQYAYLPAGYRTYFVKQDGAWKMTVFIAGD